MENPHQVSAFAKKPQTLLSHKISNNTGVSFMFTENLTQLSCLINLWYWKFRFIKCLFAGWFIFKTIHTMLFIIYSWKHWQMMGCNERILLLNVKTKCILSQKDYLHFCIFFQVTWSSKWYLPETKKFKFPKHIFVVKLYVVFSIENSLSLQT